jgi:anaerobic magnesium-protoporphyrin IX monomethyl ester cyclase
MRILLLNPPARRADTPEGLYHIREELAAGYHDEKILPAQMFLVASYIKKRGQEVDLLDAEDSNVKFGQYDVVVIWASALYSLYGDLDLFRKAKETGAKTVLILNDAYDDFEAEVMQKNPFIDAAVRLWEREFTLDRLLTCWQKGKDPDFPGVIYRKATEILDMGELPPFPNLEHLEPYAQLLEDFKLKDYKSLSIIPGRGCPNRCTFCKYRSTPVRKRKVKDVISELKAASTSLNKALIVDPAFTNDVVWIKKFAHEIEKEDLNISWRTDVRAEHCSLDTLQIMKKAGCEKGLIAIETMDPRIAQHIEVGVEPEDLDKAVRNLRLSHIVPMVCFYLGLAWDSNETLSRIESFLRNRPIPWFQLRYARPWKGTPYYTKCRELGLLSRQLHIDDYVNSVNPLIDTLHLSKNELIDWKKRITRTAVKNPYLAKWALREKRVTKEAAKALLKAFLT